MPRLPIPIIAAKPEPWSPAKRDRMNTLIAKAAKDVAKNLGAHTVFIVATFADGDFLHMQDGGTSPMPKDELYRRMLMAELALEQSGGKDIKVQ